MHIGALIVDDAEDVRMLVRLLIDAANHGLFVAGEAASGPEALDRLDEIDPAVVVLDERMPGMSGLETATIILRHRPGQAMLLCSAYVDDDLRRRAEAVGIRVCLTKDHLAELPAALVALAGPPC